MRMKFWLQKDRKGLSEMVGYVLLIVIAVGIAAGVYAFLNFYVPKDNPKCPTDVSVNVREVKCVGGYLNITLENRGLFSVDGAFVKIGNSSRIARETLCFEGSRGNECNVYFNQETTTDGRKVLDEGLKPGEMIMKSFNYTNLGEQELEVGPVVFVDNYPAICTDAIQTRTVNCI